jgi:phosphate acetyltransferase
MSFIENRTFDELKIGDLAQIKRTLSLKDIELFSIMSGDVNSAHVDAEYAKDEIFHQIIVQGMWGAAGMVMGASVPIILTSCGSDDISRKASCAMALVYVRNKEKLNG